MARLFRSTYTTKNGDNTRSQHQTTKWYGEYVDLLDRTKRVALSTNRDSSRRALDSLVDALQQARSRVTVNPAGLPPIVRKTFLKALRESGHQGAMAESAAKPLANHVDDWRRAVLAKGATDKYVDLSVQRVEAILTGTKAIYWNEVDPNKVAEYLAERREHGLSIESSNHYTRRIKQFCRWMVKTQRATVNPLECLTLLNARTDRRHDRRPLTTEELTVLLRTTAECRTRHGLSGADRVLVYRLAVEAGLRATEIRSLMPRSFTFDAKPCTVTVSAAYSKHRREDVLPLRQPLADLMQGRTRSMDQNEKVFGMAKDHLSRMIKADLRDSGIPYRDDAGRVADFHSLRHTFITNLARGGVHPKIAQALARHSTITLTMDRYSHTVIGEQAEALNALPNLDEQPDQPATNRAVGTYDDSPIGPAEISAEYSAFFSAEQVGSARHGLSSVDTTTSSKSTHGQDRNGRNARKLGVKRRRVTPPDTEREWMGIEPTRRCVNNASTALKAAGPTRRPDTPGESPPIRR